MNQSRSILNLAETAISDVFSAQDTDAAQQDRFADFANKGLPHPRSENWRWSDLHGAIRSSLVSNVGVRENSAAAPGAGETVLEGDEVTSLEIEAESEHPIALLAGGLAGKSNRRGYLIGQSPAEPLQLRSKSSGVLSGSQVQCLVRSGVSVTIIETSQQSGAGLSSVLREFVLEPGANLVRILIHPEANAQTRVHRTTVEVGESASFTQYTLDFGARFSRNETCVHSVGPNTNVKLNAAYLLQGSAQCDMTSLVRHDHPHCQTSQLCKGVVLDKANAVFQGKFHVAREGQQTDAKMGHHCLLLTDQGRVRAKPELEIYADDVACAHGNTTGSLDEEALFYMRQRGLPEDTARQLLVRAFVLETLVDYPDEIAVKCISMIENWSEQKL